MRREQFKFIIWLCWALFLSITPALTGAQSDTQVVTGSIDDQTPFVEIPLSVPEDNTALTVDIQPLSGDLDTLLYLVDGAGAIVAENDDRERGDYSSLIEFPAAEAGQYTIIATRYGVIDGSSSGEFELVIRQGNTDETAALNYDISAEAIAAAGFPQIEPRETADWTVIAYYGGDTNLEPGIMNDFNEFEIAGGSNDDVRIVMMLDRHPEFTDASGDWTDTRIFEMGPDVSMDHELTHPPTLDTAALQRLGELDTGDGETLAQYLVWALRHFPAERYAVAFASHGAGWKGIITDYTNDHSIITVPELRRAFEVATQEVNVERFDLLINDACNMSSIEYFAGVADYFNYSVASPEIVVDPALDMTQFTNAINQQPDVDVSILGRQLVDTYVERDMLLTGGDDSVFLTNAVTDLTRFDPVTQAVEAFAALFNAAPSRYAQTFGEARRNTYTYSHFLGGRSTVDLGNFMRRVQQAARDDALIEAAQNVLDALDAARLYGNGGASVTDRVSYYNIYFPDSSTRFNIDYFDQTTLPGWSRMLRNYYNAVTPQVWTGAGFDVAFHPPIAPKTRITNVIQGDDSAASILRPVILRAEIVNRNLSYVDATHDLIQADGSAIRLGSERVLKAREIDGETRLVNDWTPGVTNADIIWDAALNLVSDGENAHFELLEFTEATGFMDAVYREPGSADFNEVSIVFSREKGSVDRVINRAQDTEALAVVSIPEGSEVIAYRYLVGPDGRVTQELGNRYTWPPGGLTFSFEPAPNGAYQVGILATAFGGTTDYDSARVTLDNTGLDTSLRGGITDTGLGFATVREKDASRFAFRADDYSNFLLRSTRNDDLRNVSVYFVREGDPSGYTVAEPPQSLEAIADEIVELYRLEPTSAYSETTVDGEPALEFDYRRVAGDGNHIGRMAVTFAKPNPRLLLGLGFATEAAAGEATVDDVYPFVRDNSRVYDAFELAAEDTSVWRMVLVPALASLSNVDYSVPIAWTQQTDDTGAWVRYQRPNDPLTFAALGRFDGQTPINILAGDAAEGAADIAIDQTRIYSAQYNEWDVLVYNATRDGQQVLGRIYTTTRDGATYAVWVETPDDDDARDIYEDFLEPLVDGIEIGPLEDA